MEILQNCNIFNDGAWETVTEKDARSENIVQLEHGKPLIFGKNRDKGIRLNGLDLEVVQLWKRRSPKKICSFTTKSIRAQPTPFCSRTWSIGPDFPTPIGVFRSWDDVPRYEDLINDQIREVQAKRGKGDLAKLPPLRRHLGA